MFFSAPLNREVYGSDFYGASQQKESLAAMPASLFIFAIGDSRSQQEHGMKGKSFLGLSSALGAKVPALRDKRRSEGLRDRTCSAKASNSSGFNGERSERSPGRDSQRLKSC